MLTASIVVAIKCSSIEVLGRAEHDVRAIVSMYAIVVRGIANRRLLPRVRPTYKEQEEYVVVGRLSCITLHEIISRDDRFRV